MRAGLLKKRIDVQRLMDSQDEYGEPTTDWVSLFVTWARIEPTPGGESVQSGQVTPEVSHKLTIRYRVLQDGLRWQDLRIVFRNRIFGIASIVDGHELSRRWLELNCGEVSGDEN